MRCTRTLMMICALAALSVATSAQGGARDQASPRPAKRQAPTKLDAKKQFVVDVVRAAVNVPQSDQVDRLRVLAAASSVVMPVRPAMAREFSKEGLRIEQETIQRGEAPPTSMLTSGPVSCAAVSALAENVPVSKVDAAESTLIAAIDRCPTLTQTVQRLVTAALEKRVVAPRLMLALVERAGPSTPWAQQTLENFYTSLPAPGRESSAEAPDLAAMYSQVAQRLPADRSARLGVQLLSWLSQVSPSKSRNLAVNVTTGALRERLGDEEFSRALATDAGALQVAQSAGQAGEVDRPEEESVSVLMAMQRSDVDRTDELEKLEPSLRAREAAASGFAVGTEGNGRMADHYFDIAFRALESVWSSRERHKDAADVVEEVSQAAAHVNPMDALQRSQRLQDPAAQAIAMIAVARVVANQ